MPVDNADTFTVQWVFDGVFVIASGIVAYLLRQNGRISGDIEKLRMDFDTKLEKVRTEALKVAADGDASLERALRRMKDDLMEPINEIRREVADSQRDSAKWRENIAAVMATRMDMERGLDKLVERLDERIAPLIDRRRASHNPHQG